jgi:hypothetical protein
LGPLERASLNHWTNPSPMDGNRSSFRNVVFSLLFRKNPDERKYQLKTKLLLCPFSTTPWRRMGEWSYSTTTPNSDAKWEWWASCSGRFTPEPVWVLWRRE